MFDTCLRCRFCHGSTFIIPCSIFYIQFLVEENNDNKLPAATTATATTAATGATTKGTATTR